MSRKVLLAAAALALVLAGAWAVKPGAPARVEVPEGLSARQTAELLGAKGVVQSVFVFRALLKITGFDRHLKPGTYILRIHEWPTIVARKLTLGLTDDLKITIPEGFRASQVAERLEKAGIVDAREFLALVSARKLEGRLFPSTYNFPAGYGAERVIRKMTQEFERRAGPLYLAARSQAELTLDQVVTLASIVERESSVSAEKPMIAAVYLNRLRRRMRLQSVPTVQYALGHWKKEFDATDVTVDSPYNTYIRYGLPPGPICSPGLDSIAAVLSPAAGDALYLMADGKGANVFSATNEEHVRNRRRYEKKMRAAKEELKKQARSGAVPAR